MPVSLGAILFSTELTSSSPLDCQCLLSQCLAHCWCPPLLGGVESEVDKVEAGFFSLARLDGPRIRVQSYKGHLIQPFHSPPLCSQKKQRPTKAEELSCALNPGEQVSCARIPSGGTSLQASPAKSDTSLVRQRPGPLLGPGTREGLSRAFHHRSCWPRGHPAFQTPCLCSDFEILTALPAGSPVCQLGFCSEAASWRQPGVTFTSCQPPPEGLLATQKGREEREDPGETPIDGGFSSSAAAARQCPASRLPAYSSGSAGGGGGLDPAEGLRRR